MRIITGSTGTTHVTSNDDGEFNQGIFGIGLVVLENGGQLEATIVDNNTIRIKDGDLIMQGRHALIAPNTVEDVVIETGAVGVNRNDLIVARYQMDLGTGYENITLEVVKGTETAGEASDPEYVSGDIRTGSSIVEMPLYRVRISGISIAGIDKLFAVSQNMYGMISSQKETLTDTKSGTVFRFGIDEEGNYGYIKAGADTVTPFSNPNLKFDPENGGIFAMDESGQWTLIHKTDCLPIFTFDGVLYNAGVYNELYFAPDFITTVTGNGAGFYPSEASRMRIYHGPAASTSSIGMFCMSTPIDTRRFNVLNITTTYGDGNYDNTCHIGIGATTDIKALTGLLSYKQVSNSTATMQIDVSEYDEVYLYIYTFHSSGSFVYKRTRYITKIWLTN